MGVEEIRLEIKKLTEKLKVERAEKDKWNKLRIKARVSTKHGFKSDPENTLTSEELMQYKSTLFAKVLKITG